MDNKPRCRSCGAIGVHSCPGLIFSVPEKTIAQQEIDLGYDLLRHVVTLARNGYSYNNELRNLAGLAKKHPELNKMIQELVTNLS